MRVAALYDIHGNLPALEAVLDDVVRSDVDQIVVGGDVVPGPLPCETLRHLIALDRPVHFIVGNGELAMLAQMAAPNDEAVTYWGTTSGNPVPEAYRAVYRWTAQQLRQEYELVLAQWPKTFRLEVAGIGRVLFCHGSPRSETEIFTRTTPVRRLALLFGDVEESLVVCGHTHMQFDLTVGTTRVVNAGSVGAPYGEPGAYWLLLGPDVQLRRTAYDLASAAARIRLTEYPRASEFAEEILHPASEREMLEAFTAWEVSAEE